MSFQGRRGEQYVGSLPIQHCRAGVVNRCVCPGRWFRPTLIITSIVAANQRQLRAKSRRSILGIMAPPNS